MVLEHFADQPGRIGSSNLLQLEEALKCLAWRPADYRRWAGPIAAEEVAKLRTSPFRDRIAAACGKILNSPPETADRRELTRLAAYTLASYGVGEADGNDVFELLAWEKRFPPYFALAALGDSRTVPLLKATYDSLASIAPRTDRVRFTMLQVLNCLYHVGGDSARSLARVIASQEEDTVIVERATRVANRN
jgi:hypothetical protein